MQGPARPGQAAPDTGQSRFPPHLIRLLRRMRSACRSPRVLPIRCLLSSTTSSLAPGRRCAHSLARRRTCARAMGRPLISLFLNLCRGSREIRRLDYDLRVGTRRSGPPHGGTGALRVTAIIAGSCNILAICDDSRLHPLPNSPSCLFIASLCSDLVGCVSLPCAALHVGWTCEAISA
ncbi:hypothetical protein C2845_PM08G19580 [Panicum miliaceum]|uniref:Uncharacterized protein n=1 Tax=Panicum miliaceum TaxID=4540 RepID=A0A3L6R0M2_PANMI|nr:hypothetical protein C2845_PM08G19580 [Panicum miliaceum]